MHELTAKSRFQEALESVDSLPLDDHESIIEVVQKRVTEKNRADLIRRVDEARASFASGETWRGSANDPIAMIGV